MSRLGEPADGGYTFVVTLPNVDLLLRNETFVGWNIRAQVNSDIMRSVEKVATLVVDRIIN